MAPEPTPPAAPPAPPATPTFTPPPAPTPDPNPGATPGAEDLGDAGKRALDAERKARKDAEKEAATLAVKVQQFEDAQRTEGEKLTARAEAAEARAAAAEAKAARAEIISELGIPADIANDIAGNTPEEFRAAAERIKARMAASPPPRFAGGTNQGPNNVDAGTPSLDERIAEAQKAGDVKAVITLQNEKLAQLPPAT